MRTADRVQLLFVGLQTVTVDDGLQRRSCDLPCSAPMAIHPPAKTKTGITLVLRGACSSPTAFRVRTVNADGIVLKTAEEKLPGPAARYGETAMWSRGLHQTPP